MNGYQSAPIGHIRATRSSGAAVSGTDVPSVIAVDCASPADAPPVAAVIAAAFLNDPTWSWAFPVPAARMRYWEMCVADALRYSWVFRSENFETVSVWIPPGGTEFSPQDEQRLPQLLAELVGPRAPEVAELIRRFGEAHPRREPHYYLSLLGTADEHRGRGLGMALLRENLARVDAENMPAYLESSNPRNDHLYESVGFEPIVSFQAPGGGPTVTGMWRPSGR
jgi:GNAT superfamily N-acetyltransferase